MNVRQTFTVPSKKSVRRAGNVLAGISTDMSLVDAMDTLSKWRALHAYPINTLQAYIRSLL